MVSWEIRDRSLAYRSWISFSLGCRALIALICLSCFNVNGIVTKRMSAVNTMIARPILLNNTVYSTTSELSMGRIMNSVQRNEMASKGCPTSLPRSFGELSGLVETSGLSLGVQAPHVALATLEIYAPYGFVLRSHVYGVSNGKERSFDVSVSYLLIEQHSP